MFYRNYVTKIDSKNRKLYNNFLDSKKSSKEFWETVPAVTFIEKYWYEVCLKLIKVEDFLIKQWNLMILKLLLEKNLK